MSLLRSTLISILLTMLLARYFYEQAPPGISQPMLLRAAGMPIKVCFDMVSCFLFILIAIHCISGRVHAKKKLMVHCCSQLPVDDHMTAKFLNVNTIIIAII